MKIVRRLVAGKHIKTLRRSDAHEQELAEAKSQLLAGGAAVIPALFEALHDRDARPHAIEVLSQLVSNDTLPTFLSALGSEDAVVAQGVTELLSSVSSYDSASLLDEVGSGGLARPRIETILMARGATLPLRKLLPTLEDEDNESRELIYRLIETHGDSSMVPHVTRMLEHDDMWVRIRAIKLLRQFPNEQAIEGIKGALRDPSPNVRLEAVRTLEHLRCTDAIPELARALRDNDLKVHAAAIDALSAIGDLSAVPHLIEVLKDESEYARRGAVEVLNEVATTEAIKDLVRALRDADWWVRVRAADALGSLGGERVVEALLQLLETEDDFVRRYAVEILITVHDARAVEPLIRRLHDPDWWVRERAIDALAKIGDARAVEPLIDLMAVDPDASPLCARALGSFGDERAVDALCHLATTGSPEQSQEAIGALQALARADLTPEVRKLIRETLGSLGAKPRDSHLAPSPLRSRPVHDTQVGQIPPDDLSGRSGPPPSRVAGDRTQTVDDGSGGRSPSSAPRSPASPQGAPATVDVRTLKPGDVLRERYEVIRKIGSGGFGSVFLVQDRTISDEVILKILSPHICQDETVVRRFVHELKYTRRIAHKNVIRLFDFLQFDGLHVISMEYFDGVDLARIIRKEKSLSPAKTIGLAKQICAGLGAAHEEGIIHRDIKPPNVLVNEREVVKIVDFGLASMAQSTGSQLTRSGIIIGTPQYMAPEQISGGGTPDARTDVYALGVVMFELLTGKQPFNGETAVNILFQHLEAEIPSIRELAPHVTEELEAAVRCAMSKKPDDRPANAVAFSEMLEALSPETVDEG